MLRAMRRLKRPTLALSLLVTLASALMACGSSENPRFFAAHAASSDVALGALKPEGHLLVYACGGPSTLATHTRWFDVPLSGPTFSAESGGTTITGKLAATGLSGTLEVPGSGVISWTLPELQAGALSGLYDRVENGCRTGVIVFSDDPSAPSAQGVYCNGSGLFDEVTPVAPFQMTSEGLPVATKTAGTRILVQRL